MDPKYDCILYIHGFVLENGVVVLDMSQSSLVMQILTYTLLAECDVEMISINHDNMYIYLYINKLYIRIQVYVCIYIRIVIYIYI